MNLALPAVVLFIIFTPGFVVAIVSRFDYKRGNLIFQDYTGRSFIEKVFLSIFPSVIIHVLTLFIARWRGFYIDSRAFGTILTSSSVATEVTYAYGKLYEDYGWIFLYYLTALFLAVLLTALYRFVVVFFKLDIRFDFFRFNNPLYYTFLGADISEKFDVVVVDVLVETGGKNILYSGILSEWKYDSEGKLDTLTLISCFRRFVNDTLASNTTSKPASESILLKAKNYFSSIMGHNNPKSISNPAMTNPGIASNRLEIPGSGTVLKSSKIVNYNFQYLTHRTHKEWSEKLRSKS
jgi:hypothetical protein